MDPTLPYIHRAFFIAIEKMLSCRGGHFISGSVSEVDTLRRLGVPDNRINFLQFGVSPQAVLPRDALRREFGLDETETVIGFVGRLAWQKAPERAIKAVWHLNRPDVTLVIIGEGELEGNIRSLAEVAGLRDKVRFLGWQDGERMMPAFDILLQPSRYESSPYVLLEALMAEVPVVTTRIGMAEQLLARGRAGRLVENTNDPMHWADALASLLEERALKDARADTKSLRSVISLEAMVEQVEAIYERATVAAHSRGIPTHHDTGLRKFHRLRGT
jgi:glycosyltransferase involved in cell wall biosynthesis